jgi:long-chain acyl-CoA synthetase
MTSPTRWAERSPDKPAVVMAGLSGTDEWSTGHTITYRELDERSAQLAHHLRSCGLEVGDHVALVAENHPEFLVAIWGFERAGLYYTAVNSHLTAPEIAYIIDDCDARVVLSSPRMEAITESAVTTCARVQQTLVFGSTYDAALAAQPTTPLDVEYVGGSMLYSSGTTGQPKGIMRPLPGILQSDVHPFESMLSGLYSYADDTVYLSPAPLYHAAPLGFNMTVLRLGGTIVLMERFDAAAFLQLVEQHAITHTHTVPTNFVRILKLPHDERTRYDLSSLRSCVHAAAPCPVDIKQEMLEWWLPLGIAIDEYYGGTELNGLTFIRGADWLAHPGSVGQALMGRIRILDDAGDELPPGEIGSVYFAEGGEFAYYKDPAKTAAAAATDGTGSTTIGDVGYLDADGYLFLTDRKAFMIIAGGVNIYPQEAEDALITHPSVIDVAVFGIPDTDLGERVHAVVQPAPHAVPGPELEAELLAYVGTKLAAYKCPKAIDFMEDLPRLDTGKLYKRPLRDRYWKAHAPSEA